MLSLLLLLCHYYCYYARKSTRKFIASAQALRKRPPHILCLLFFGGDLSNFAPFQVLSDPDAKNASEILLRKIVILWRLLIAISQVADPNMVIFFYAN